MVDARDLLLGAASAALTAVNGRRRVRDFLRGHPIDGPVCLIAVGKASASMAQGAVDALGARIVSGLVVSKRGLEDKPIAAGAPLIHIKAGHPVPDEGSLEAGHRLLALIDGLAADTALVFLVSGGASSLVEVLPQGVGLADLHRLNEWLLASGWDIAAVNGLRKRLSCIKGGRLALRVRGRPVYNLLMSDVPDNDPATIGSGMLVPGPSAAGLCARGLPPWLRRLLEAAPSVPVPDAPCFASIRTHIIASAVLACRAAVDYAHAKGCPARGHHRTLTGDTGEAAGAVADQLACGPAGLHVWVGETTVRLPASPGRGGRNQSLALAVAARIEGDPRRAFVSLGSDGNDGNTPDAGAVVDGGTLDRGRVLGLEAGVYLRRADAGTYLERVGALVYTGATGTNVTDLMLGIS